MKRKIIASIFLFMVFCASKAQNLVSNYSFENIIQCTQNCTQFIGYVANWTGQTGVGGPLGYFSSQCPGDAVWPSGSVPYNYASGFQYAHTGVSYAGIWTFGNGSTDTTKPFTNNFDSNARNYIETELINPLKAGNKYYVTFFVNLQNTSNYACNDMGAYFSNSGLTFNNTTGTNLPYIPQVANDPKKQELTDTLNWMKIAGSFVAVGGEKYITIGNFKNDASSSIRYLGQVIIENLQAYYYIDDVIVSPDSNYADSIEAINELKVESVQCKVYPNPSNGIFQFQIANGQQLMANSQIEIYNVMGEKVYTVPLPQTPGGTLTIIDLSNKANGIYLYRVTDKEGNLIKADKIIIER